jgi:hypothetical protein
MLSRARRAGITSGRSARRNVSGHGRPRENLSCVRTKPAFSGRRRGPEVRGEHHGLIPAAGVDQERGAQEGVDRSSEVRPSRPSIRPPGIRRFSIPWCRTHEPHRHRQRPECLYCGGGSHVLSVGRIFPSLQHCDIDGRQTDGPGGATYGFSMITKSAAVHVSDGC